MAPKHKLSVSKISKTKTKTKINNASKKIESKKKNKSQEEESKASNSLAKRNNSPGVRVIHGRIYDSENGKCCHQCRQKTRDFSVQCKNQSEDKPCSFYFCHKCLLNRYGEKAEEMATLGNWKCPKCRGICNCSQCRKKQGFCPIGSLSRVAKESGFASVPEMLQSKDYKKDMNVALTGKLGKENSSNGKSSSKSKCVFHAHGDKDGISGTKKVIKNNVGKKEFRKIPKGDGGSSKNAVSSKKDGNLSRIGKHQKEDVSNGKSSSKPKCKSKGSDQKDGISRTKIVTNNNDSKKDTRAKRSKSPGVRVIHGRIYDSQNGKCCHQCRQKTRDFSVQCKHQAEDKKCCCYFCHTCLMNRYGEKAEEISVLADWKCPKCRSICNCSICRKKQGYCPTGRLFSIAKESGFASVPEMLQSEDYKKDVNAALVGIHQMKNVSNGKSSSKYKRKSKDPDQNYGISGTKRIIKNNDSNQDTKAVLESASGSSKKLFSSEKFQQDFATYSIGGHKRGIILDGDTRRKLNFEAVELGTEMETSELRNGEIRGDLSVGNNDDSSCKEKSDLQKCHISEEKNIIKENSYIKYSFKGKKRTFDMTASKEKCEKKIKRENEEMVIIFSSEDKVEERSCQKDDFGQLEEKNLDAKDPEEKCDEKETKEENDVVASMQSEDDVEMVMPQGVELTKVAKIDFAAEDIGHALQFLEFCDAFGQVLNVKKWQPECLLRELADEQCSCHVGDSAIVDFQIKLLLMIHNNIGEKYNSLDSDSTSSWWQAISRYVSDTNYQMKEFPLDQNDLSCKSYGELSLSKKLRLLIFLCDEALGSVEVRNWMDERNSVYDEEKRKEKENDRKKEKEVKMKLQNELARAVLANNGAPLSVSEHQDLVSKIKAEAALTIADLGIKKNQQSEVIRLEPILLDENGCKFWKLRGHSEEKIMLLQECREICKGDSVSFTERWFSYNIEEGTIPQKNILGRLRK